MLIKAKTLRGFKLHCLDGELGKVDQFYFDDRHWAIRYLIIDTGNWLTGRQVLISPHALVAVNQCEQTISVNLTKKQIENSPALESDTAVSHQFEEEYHGYYGFPMYWTGPFMWGPSPYIVQSPTDGKKLYQGRKESDHHLHSTHEVSGHIIEATDGEIGRIVDFIIDDETWAIRYLVIDTQNWWSGKMVLISPQWIERMSWSECRIYVNVLCKDIMQSPEYTEETLLTRDYEAALHQHYDRQGYWEDEMAARGHSL